MSNTLQEHLRLESPRPGVYERECDRTFWGHGALFGGYPQALALSAMGTEVGEPTQVPMAVTMHFLRPFVEGSMHIEASVERRGRTMSNATARLVSGGKLAGLALASFGTQRETPEFFDVSMPDVAPFDPAEPPISPRANVPTHDLFEFWPRLGNFDFVTSEVAVAGGWVLPREPWPVDQALLLLLFDLWIPAAYSCWPRPAVAVSIDITAHFREALPAALPPGTPLFVVLRTKASRHGYVDEDAEVWTPDGALLGQCRQMRYVTPLPDQDA